MNIQHVVEKRKQEVPKIALEDNVLETVRLFSRNAYKAAVVVDEHQALCGIVTEHDLVRSLGKDGEEGKRSRIQDIMSLDLIVCTPQTSVQEAMKLMSDNLVHHLPIVDESGHMRGFVSMMEVMVSFVEST